MSCSHAEIVDGRCRDCGHELDAESHSWRPSSLIARAAEPPEPPTIGALLYPRKRIVLSGETESLKTWLALILAKAEMDAGYAVAWADLDAMGPGELLARFRALGVADDVVDRLFLYYEPSERLVKERLVEVCQEIADRGVRLFVADAFNPFLNLHGLDPGSTSDVETFWREVASPITDAGAAPTLLDHVAKNPDARGKYAYGSERKASGAIVHIGFRLLEPFTRGGTGRSLLTTHKDRPGYLPRPTLGRLVLVSDGDAVTYRLEDDRSHAGDGFRPTFLMERVSERLEAQVERKSQRWIEENVTGKGTVIRKALEVLVDEGYVGHEAGRGYLSVRPYREADEEGVRPDRVPGDLTASPVRPDRVPNLVSSSHNNAVLDRVPGASPVRPEGRSDPQCVPASHPLGGDEDAPSDLDALPPLERVPDDLYCVVCDGPIEPELAGALRCGECSGMVAA